MIVIVSFFVFQWYLALFCQSFFLHRYGAHRAFTMSRLAEKFFFCFTWLCQGPNYLSPHAYAVMHRRHHAFVDTPDDPHSPKYERNLFGLMLKTWRHYDAIVRSEVGEKRYAVSNTPKWEAFDSIASSLFSRVFWIALYFWIYVRHVEVWWLWLIFPVHCLLAPLHGAIVNWGAHKYGYRNFDNEDESRNLLPFDLLMMGEGYHNNHHHQCRRANFGGIRWHELDLTYVIIRILDRLGFVQLASRSAMPKRGRDKVE